MSHNSGAGTAVKLIPFPHREALDEPEKLLAQYYESSAVGICILDSSLRYLGVNQALATMNGYPPSDHVGKTVRQILGDFADTVEQPLRSVLATGEPVSLVLNGVLPTRTESGMWVGYYIPLRDAADAVTQIGCVIVETTQQARLAESLNDANGKLRQQIDRVQALLEVSNILGANCNVTEVFRQISARLRRIFRQEYASLYLLDTEGGLLIPQAVDFPLGKGFLNHEAMKADSGPTGTALRERRTTMFSKEEIQGFDSEVISQFEAEGIRSLCFAPLLRPDRPLGMLVLGSTRGRAFEAGDTALITQVASQLAFAVENHRAVTEIEALRHRLGAGKNLPLREPLPKADFSEIVGDSPALRAVLAQVATVAASDAIVLILGETGTGKELIARALHRLSGRRSANLVKVNCAAIPTGLLESELFGHEKGAFTGAVCQKIGRLELADRGTLLLDEIGEIPLELQPKLLRALQDQEFERLGSTRTLKVDARIVAATNRDLARSVTEGNFRSDLYYRLNVFPVRVPPLRERPEDIELLVRYFVHKFARRMGRKVETIPHETMRALSAWSWPGNVRELENLMERSVILSEGSTLNVPLTELQAGPHAISSEYSLENAEREHILRVLREVGGVLSGPGGAARRLGLKRTTLQSKMARLRISRQDYLQAQGI